MIKSREEVQQVFDPLGHVLRQVINSKGDSIALITESGSTTTYAEIGALSSLIAGALRPLLQASGSEWVILELDMGQGFLASVVAAIRLGIGYIPIPPSLDEAYRQLLIHKAGNWPRLDDTWIAELSTRGCTDEEWQACPGDSPLYAMPTSGSTGESKLAVLPRQSIILLRDSFLREYVREGERWSQIHRLSFGFSTLEYFLPLLSGGTIYAVDAASASGVLGPEKLATHLQNHQIENICLTPSGLSVFLHAIPNYSILKNIGRIFLSGEKLLPELIDRWNEIPASCRPNLINTYAATESGGQAIWCHVHESSTEGLIGRPLPHVRVHLIDDRELPDSSLTVGRLAIESNGLFLGYLGQDAVNRRSYVINGVSRILLLTDDIVEVDHKGWIYYRSRASSVVKLRGVFVDTEAVSARVAEDEEVDQSCCLIMEQDGVSRLISFVTRKRKAKVQIWPTLGEFNEYDSYTFAIMASQAALGRGLKEQIRGAVAGKRVIDVGCGSDLLMTQLAIEAGACRVLAIESEEAFADAARRKCERMQWQHAVKVLTADASNMRLEGNYDIAITRVFGNICSADGLIPVVGNLNHSQARRLKWLPSRCVTRIAGIGLGRLDAENFEVSAEAELYFQRLQKYTGNVYTGRVCLRQFRPDRLVTEPGIFESLDLNKNSFSLSESIELIVKREALLSGLLLWAVALQGEEVLDDYLESQTGWLPVYLPVFLDPVQVNPGDQIRICQTSPNYDLTHPDFSLDVAIVKADEMIHRSRFESGHCLTNPMAWHMQLESLRAKSKRTSEEDFGFALLRRLRQLNPGMTMPDLVVAVDQFPTTSNCKIDRRELLSIAERQFRRDPSKMPPSATGGVTQNRHALESLCIAEGARILGRPIKGDEDLFLQGASSLDAAALAAALSERLGERVHIAMIYDFPSAHSLAAAIQQEYFSGYAAAQLAQKNISTGPQHQPTASSSEIEKRSKLDELDLQMFSDRCAQACPGADAALESSSLSNLSDPVFILCPPRSGSTLLRVMMAGNSRVIAPPELELLRFKSLQDWKETFSGRNKLWREGLIEFLMFLENLQEAEAIAKINHLCRETSMIEQVYDYIANSTSPARYVEKSTYYALFGSCIKRVLRHFPTSRVIHLVRDPICCVNSYAALRLHQYSPVSMDGYGRHEMGELIWHASHRNILKHCSMLNEGRYLRLHYEGLVSDPVGSLKIVCHFIDVDYEPEMLNVQNGGPRRMTQGPNKNTIMVGDPHFFEHHGISTNSNAKWTSVSGAYLLSDEVMKLHDQLRVYNY